jgi:hypothetical protein
MGHAIIRGNSVDEKFASADKALLQLERRIAARSIVAPLTPIVVMGYCNQADDGVIFKGMFPMSGFITKVSLFIEKLEDENFLKNNLLRICVKLYQENGTEIKREFPTKKLYIGEVVSYAIAANSRVEVLINTKAFGIYYGLVLEPETPIKKRVDFIESEDTNLLLQSEPKMIEE